MSTTPLPLFLLHLFVFSLLVTVLTGTNNSWSLARDRTSRYIPGRDAGPVDADPVAIGIAKNDVTAGVVESRGGQGRRSHWRDRGKRGDGTIPARAMGR